MKTLLLPKILAIEKEGGGYVKPPMVSFSAHSPPPPYLPQFAMRSSTHVLCNIFWAPSCLGFIGFALLAGVTAVVDWDAGEINKQNKCTDSQTAVTLRYPICQLKNSQT